MKVKTTLIVFVAGTLITSAAFSQIRTSREFRQAYSRAPEEIISLSKSMTFEQTVPIFYELSKKYLGKIVISDLKLDGAIGVDIDKLYWLDAFELILRKNNLWYEDRADYLKIITPEGFRTAEKLPPDAITSGSREVVISAIFFEADGNKLRQMGFSWEFFRGQGVNLGANLTAAEEKQTLFELSFAPELDFGDLLATFRSFESQQIGEVVANPQVSVRSGVKGRIQVGSDVAYTTKDFSGNTITQFYSTGSIVEVTPLVLVEDSLTFIHLELKIERSNTSTSSGGGLEIKKSQATTSLLMLDGEETILGGLYVNEESTKRDGIPFLKDLPWWVLGLKYLFGYDAVSMIKKELLIIIKADLVPTLEERLASKLDEVNHKHILYKKRLEKSQQMDYYKKQIEKKVLK